jgi:hypothetical protein
VTDANLPPEEMSADQLLRYYPEQFEALSWSRINGPRYMVPRSVREAFPKSNRPEHSTAPLFVAVLSVSWTGEDEDIEVYESLTLALAEHGRAIRTSIDSGRPVRGVVAEVLTTA